MRMNKKLLEHLIRLNDETAPHLLAIIIRKRNGCKYLPDDWAERHEEYYLGQLFQVYSQIDTLLMMYNKYEGFQEYLQVDNKSYGLRRYYFPKMFGLEQLNSQELKDAFVRLANVGSVSYNPF